MAIFNIIRNGSQETVADVLEQARIVQAVLARLDTLARLDVLAREIYEGLAASGPARDGSREPNRIIEEWMQGEADKSTYCSVKAMEENVNFQCGKTAFDCGPNDPNPFNCQSDAVFNGCGAGKVPEDFGCSATPDQFVCQDEFDCNKETYDCGVFACSTPDGTGKFDCTVKFDFACNWTVFNCFDDFDCTAGHIFQCGTQHNCTDSFDCRSTGDPKCLTYLEYDRNGDGVVDTSGDFTCGIDGGGVDAFNCDDSFQCKAADEFDCTPNSQFFCGNKEATDSFDCGSTTKFGGCNPAAYFGCDTIDKFTCSNQTSKYSGGGE